MPRVEQPAAVGERPAPGSEPANGEGPWQAVRSSFEPLTTTGRPAPSDLRYSIIRSYLAMRLVIGTLGVLLPVVLLLGDWLLLGSSATARGSLSAYYHSGMRDIFVGTLLVVAFTLLIYKIFERNLDNTLSILAGVAAMGVAFFPTHIPEGGTLTPLQDRLGEGPVAAVHYTSAATLFLLLATLSWFFGIREGKRGDRPKQGRGPHLDARLRRMFHFGAAGVVTAAIVFIALTRWITILGDWDLLVGESAALVAFGASWIYKGAELDTLRNRPAG